MSKPISILVVEDNSGDFALFEAYLQQTALSIQSLYHAKSLGDISVEAEDVDIVFLDLSLPDSGGIASFKSINLSFPGVPVVVLSGLANEEVAVECIAMGAQDYLRKNELNERLLEKSTYYSIERKKNLESIVAINRQYELIGSVTNDVIWNWCLDTNRVNCAKKSFFGYPEEQIFPQLEWWMERIHPDDKEAVSLVVAEVLERRSKSLQIEYRFRSCDGNYKYIYSRGRVLSTKKEGTDQMVGSIMDITEIKRLEKELLQSQLNIQRQLTEAMIIGEEKQKEQIGKELHDNINQILAAVKLYIDIAMKNQDLKEDLLEKSRSHVVNAIEEIRKLSHSLVPPSLGDHGLTDALREFTEEINSVGLFKIELATEEFKDEQLDAATKLVLFRIVQEQTNNIIKYAKANHVCISLEKSGSGLTLSIKDDGVGFDTSQKAKGIGLKNIESRVAYYSGKMQLHSFPGKGTRLEVTIPV